MPAEFGVNVADDGQGYQIDSTYYWDQANLYVPDLDPSKFKGKYAIAFRVVILGQSPTYEDKYEIVLAATVDGVTKEDRVSGTAKDTAEEKILLISTNYSTDVKDIKVHIKGCDSEYWAGSYGAIFKEMSLSLEGDQVELITDMSNWNMNGGSDDAVMVDTADGGKKFIFSYNYDEVWA